MAIRGSRRTTRWTPAAIPLGVLLLLLGAWVFLVPLVGPYFGYGFFTSSTWTFLGVHWELLLGPGIALFVAGLFMLMPDSASGTVGALLALVTGVWLLIGPSLYPIWGTSVAPVVPHAQWMQSLLWVGYFYGTGAIAVYLGGMLHGMLSRRPVVVEDSTVIHEAPVERHERVAEHV